MHPADAHRVRTAASTRRRAKPWPAVDDAEPAARHSRNGSLRGSTASRGAIISSRLSLTSILESLLDWPQRQRLETIAPTHLGVPSGSRIPDRVHRRKARCCAVRLQEVFGMTETPLLGGGKVAVIMQLLSPARRPVQVTRDLKSFWARGYSDVRKELKGRYPRHYWPDNPLEAEATARAKPRGRRP